MEPNIEPVVSAYLREDWRESRRLAVTELVRHGGIDLLHIAGMSLMQMRHVEPGMALLKAAVALEPDAPHIYSNAAHVAESLGMPEELSYFTDKGLDHFPENADLLRQKGNLSLLRMDYPAAIALYSAQLRVNPTDVSAHINIGNTYRILGEFDEALIHFDQAEALQPGCASGRVGHAIVCGDLGRLDEGIALLDGIEDWDAKYIRALFWLASGDYLRGWDLHRDRWYCLLFKGVTAMPVRCHEVSQIVGKHITVLREGGYGDTFQFVRYVQMIAQHAASVILHGKPSEMRLLRANLPANVNVLSMTDEQKLDIPRATAHVIAMLDLPYLFKTEVSTIPATIPYLQVPAEIVAQRRLPPRHTVKRVGLVWAGGPSTGLNERSYDSQRSLKLHQLASFAELEQIEYINLQFGPAADEIGLTTTRVLDPDCDWAATAAIISQLDLVISVDTAVVHVSAAMGRPTWLLSRFNCCWRWLRNRPESPWYPDVLRVFGQPSFGDWQPAIHDVRTALEVWQDS